MAPLAWDRDQERRCGGASLISGVLLDQIGQNHDKGAIDPAPIGKRISA